MAQHLEDTHNIAGLLWEHWLGDGQRRVIDDSLDEQSKGLGKKLIQFLAAVHDLGKAIPAFQTMSGHSNSKDLDNALLEKLERAGFTHISTDFLVSKKKTRHNIASQYLLSYYGVDEDIAAIVGGHHGKPIDSKDEYENQFSYKKNYFQSEHRNSVIYKKWFQEQKNIFDWSLEISGFNKVEQLPKIKQPGQIILSGLLIMADWIASNEHFFPLIRIDEDEVQDKSERLRIGFYRWKTNNKSDIWEPKYYSDFQQVYKKRFDFYPRNVQLIFAEILDTIKDPGIIILEAPMGIGKTEAALCAVEQLAYKNRRNGLFFGLPTQATSNGIFPRIIDWLNSVKKDSEDTVSLRLVHGKAYLNDQFLSLAKGINMDDAEDGSIIVNEWFSGRKTTSLDDFVVGTVDQFLMVALKQKHLALRHLGFSKKVVIIDEVHAYDAYMSQYLLEATEWMGAYRVPVVILSATLPEQKRYELIKSYMKGKGVRWNKTEREEIEKSLKTSAYPLISYNDGKKIHQVKEFEKTKNKRIRIMKLSDDHLIELINSATSDGGVVGIIVNTVKRAQELTRICSDIFGDDIQLLHSGFIATDRIKKENDLVHMIGKNAERPARKIIIGTQVIEQSLDIDFDVLISDLAPMDLLIQRIGRLHRHTIKRPIKHKEPVCYVLGTNDDLNFEEGSSSVYGDYLLTRTQYFLPDFINIPKDISVLVQNVYGAEDISLEIDLETKYRTDKKDYENYCKGKKDRAANYRIEPPVLKETLLCEGNLIGWLKNPIYDESEEKSCAQVRDVSETIEVIALKRVENGYGFYSEEKDISNQIDDWKTAKKIAQNTLRLPGILSASYNIDDTIRELEKYNIKYLNAWQNSSWLKGTLGIVFDENNEFQLNGVKLSYSNKYGITVERT